MIYTALLYRESTGDAGYHDSCSNRKVNKFNTNGKYMLVKSVRQVDADVVK